MGANQFVKYKTVIAVKDFFYLGERIKEGTILELDDQAFKELVNDMKVCKPI